MYSIPVVESPVQSWNQLWDTLTHLWRNKIDTSTVVILQGGPAHTHLDIAESGGEEGIGERVTPESMTLSV